MHSGKMYTLPFLVQSFKETCSIVRVEMSRENSHQSFSHSVNSGGSVPFSVDVRISVVYR